jgi:FkbM family methyltransferase
MRLRGFAKKVLFGYAPFVRGRFKYYGHTVHFPPGCGIFKGACAQGIYERDTLDLILSLVRPGTTYFDVGTNIGLLSVPVLSVQPSVNVVSMEGSPDILPFLTRTYQDSGRENWKVFGTAVGAASGEVEFWTGVVATSAFDGLRDTGRGGPKRCVRVPIRTLDDVWRECDFPTVSVVKMDIEGGEVFALEGAKDLIFANKPTFIIEWFEENLRPYGIDPSKLLEVSADIDYEIYAVPRLILVDKVEILRIAMSQTWTFALVPKADPLSGSRPGSRTAADRPAADISPRFKACE